jgi:hypothetical protein
MSDIVRAEIKSLLYPSLLFNNETNISIVCNKCKLLDNYFKISFNDTQETMSKKKRNRIKEATTDAGVSSRLVALWVDVDYTTVSRWNSNLSQPENANIDKVGELLEIDNRDLLESQGRINTGLAKALEAELKRLHSEEKIPYEIEKTDKKSGEKVLANNPKLMKLLKNFAKQYLKDIKNS